MGKKRHLQNDHELLSDNSVTPTKNLLIELHADTRFNVLSFLALSDAMGFFKTSRCFYKFRRDERLWIEISSRNALEKKFLEWGVENSDKFISYTQGYRALKTDLQALCSLDPEEFIKRLTIPSEYQVRQILTNAEVFQRIPTTILDTSCAVYNLSNPLTQLSQFMQICLSKSELSLMLLKMLQHVEAMRVGLKNTLDLMCRLHSNILADILDRSQEFMALINSDDFIILLKSYASLELSILKDERYKEYFSENNLDEIRKNLSDQIKIWQENPQHLSGSYIRFINECKTLLDKTKVNHLGFK